MLEIKGPLWDSTQGHTLEASLAFQASPDLAGKPFTLSPSQTSVSRKVCCDPQWAN